MDNQQPNQEPVNQTPTIQPPIVPEPPTPETPPIPTPEIEITPEPEVNNSEPAESVPTADYQQVLNQYSANTEKLPPIETEPAEAPSSTEEQLKDLGIATPPKTGSGFFKGLFVIALIIFVFVIVALGLVYFKSQNNTDSSDSSDIVESTPIPASGTCFLNDRNYQIGESFASADGCNTCTCESADVITCTEKACLTTITPVSTISAKKTTPTATPSATKN